DDDVRERRPCVIEIVLRRPCRMIWMRVIKAQQLAAELARLLLGDAIIGGADHEPPAWTFLGRVRKRDGRRHAVAGADERAATFVWIRLFAVSANLAVDRTVHDQCLDLRSFRHQSAFQNFSVRYFSAPSGQTVTMMPVFSLLATC